MKNTVKLNESFMKFNFEKIDSPVNAYLVCPERNATMIKKVGFKKEFIRGEGLLYGAAFYFLSSEEEAMRQLGNYGDTIVNVTIQPGARCYFPVSKMESSQFVLVHPDDANFIKINSIEHQQKADMMESRQNVVKINENTIRQIVAESLKKMLKEGKSNGVIDKELQEMEGILASIRWYLDLEEYAPNGINGLDKEKAILGIKAIKNGISALYQATYNVNSEN